MKVTYAHEALWNSLSSLLFFVMLYVVFMSLPEKLLLPTLLDLIILSFATYRLIRLASFDKITAFARNWFLDVSQTGGLEKPPGGFRRAVAELLECLWCTGVWAALLACALYYTTVPFGKFVVVILAVSAAGSLLLLLSKKITLASVSK